MTHTTTTVTLAAHARRGLMIDDTIPILSILCIFHNAFHGT